MTINKDYLLEMSDIKGVLLFAINVRPAELASR